MAVPVDDENKRVVEGINKIEADLNWTKNTLEATKKFVLQQNTSNVVVAKEEHIKFIKVLEDQKNNLEKELETVESRKIMENIQPIELKSSSKNILDFNQMARNAYSVMNDVIQRLINAIKLNPKDNIPSELGTKSEIYFVSQSHGTVNESEILEKQLAEVETIIKDYQSKISNLKIDDVHSSSGYKTIDQIKEEAGKKRSFFPEKVTEKQKNISAGEKLDEEMNQGKRLLFERKLDEQIKLKTKLQGKILDKKNTSKVSEVSNDRLQKTESPKQALHSTVMKTIKESFSLLREKIVGKSESKEKPTKPEPFDPTNRL